MKTAILLTVCLFLSGCAGLSFTYRAHSSPIDSVNHNGIVDFIEKNPILGLERSPVAIVIFQSFDYSLMVCPKEKGITFAQVVGKPKIVAIMCGIVGEIGERVIFKPKETGI